MVMPFVNMSSIREMGYLGDGIAEEILNLLAKLNVTASSTTEQQQ